MIIFSICIRIVGCNFRCHRLVCFELEILLVSVVFVEVLKVSPVVGEKVVLKESLVVGEKVVLVLMILENLRVEEVDLVQMYQEQLKK